MSDVHISTSFVNLPDGDTAYNTILSARGYDGDGVRLFATVQTVPNMPVNVGTAKARGFSVHADYNGNFYHYAATSESADLKTVRFQMSNTSSAYDLTGARCYVQFKNKYTVDIAAWSLVHVAEDDTETTIASGTTISAGDIVQVDFINDYGAGVFEFVITYESEPDPTAHGWFYLDTANPTAKPPESSNCAWLSNTNSWMGGSAVYSGYMAKIGANNYAFCTYQPNNFYVRYSTNYTTGASSASGAMSSNYNGNKYGSYSGINFGMTQAYDSLAEAANDFYNMTGAGIDTADLNDYDGTLWQCRFIANIANISPGPMATESEGGENGDFDTTSDAIAAPPTPTQYAPTGCHMYAIDAAKLQALHDNIYSPDIINQIFTNFNDLTNGIISIMQFPLAAADLPIGSTGSVFIGRTEVKDFSVVPPAALLASYCSRYVQKDCGTVALNLFWDSALDMNPYTKLSCYIPAVGCVALDPDVVMGHTIGLYYNIDLMTGAAVAVLTLDGDFLEQHACNIATHYAINGEQYSGLLQGMLSTISTAAIGFATAGSGGAIAGALTGAATSALGQKIHRDRAGTAGAGTVLLSQLQPYIEILRPIQQLPRDYTKYNAYPSYMTAQLFNLSGYAEIQDIFIDDIDATEDERAELLELLRTGVIF